MIILAFRVDASHFLDMVAAYMEPPAASFDLGCWRSSSYNLFTPSISSLRCLHTPLRTRGRGLRSGDICENGDEV